jgi:transketolase
MTNKEIFMTISDSPLATQELLARTFIDTDQLAVNAIRTLAMDMVQQANSGHPGMPMGMAAAAYVLWSRHLKQMPSAPNWLDRDRFVLSAGHGSTLLYSLLHLFGYELSMDDLKQFRQWGSKTPGHPEFGHTVGVELTTGPLGQGIASAVGMAIEETHLAATVNTQAALFDHYTYVIAGDGCLQEGVSAEAASLAGHLQLGKLIVLYDDNSITIDGSTKLSFSENVTQRYKAYGWQVIEVAGDGNHLDVIHHAITEAKAEQQRPTLIRIKTLIGYGSPNMQGSHKVHGSPLGEAEIQATKRALNWPSKTAFEVPEKVYAHIQHRIAHWQTEYEQWQQSYQNWVQSDSELAQQFVAAQNIPVITVPVFEAGQSMATRQASGKVLNALMPQLPFVLAGSADLTPSNNTWFDGALDYQANQRQGRYLRYGIREHAMAAILNGLNVGGVLRAYGGTFLVFADYLRPAVRVAALSGYPSIFVLTHDSIGVGEDGPTHQPVETIASLRAIPDLRVYRPADANETAMAWQSILRDRNHPSALLLSRQALPVLDNEASYRQLERGAYILSGEDSTDAVLMATGSEVSLALAAAELLAAKGIATRVVSMPCWALFEEQSPEYQQQVLPQEVRARVAVEAAVRQGWDAYLGDCGEFVGMTGFGASAPGGRCFKEFGITVDNIVAAACRSLAKANG